MWWTRPLLKGTKGLFPSRLLDVAVRAYSVVEVGGVSGRGAERGRRFERVFYTLCERRGVHLTEKAGATSLAEGRSASGFRHEVDAATRGIQCLTHWELKHLSSHLEKNELLIFNNKGLDFLQGATAFYAKIPLRRFLLSGNNVRDECRHFAALWGITLIEPGRLPLPLIYEVVAREAPSSLSSAEIKAIFELIPWTCRPLQSVVSELAAWSNGAQGVTRIGPSAIRAARSAMDLQEQMGNDILDHLDDRYPDWLDDVAEETWQEIGGW